LPDNYAYITYEGTPATDVRLAIWNMTTGTFVSNTMLDAATSIAQPRIDALDDYRRSTNTLSNFKVVAQVLNPVTSAYEVRAYDFNSTALLPYWTPSRVINLQAWFSGYPSPAYNHYAPTVAMYGQQDFLVSHFTEYTLGSNTEDALFMEPISIAKPDTLFTHYTPGYTDSFYYYYWVNNKSTGGGAAPPGVDAYGTYANAVASAPNWYYTLQFYAWAQYDMSGTSNSYDVYYKYNNSTPDAKYSFRQGATAPGTVVAGTSQKWQVYPNPAASLLTLDMGAGTPGAATYAIMDMAGRSVATGNVQGSNTNIAVNKLPPGNYVLQLYDKDNAAYGRAQFVKQ
jgi:hypothetical protein